MLSVASYCRFLTSIDDAAAARRFSIEVRLSAYYYVIIRRGYRQQLAGRGYNIGNAGISPTSVNRLFREDFHGRMTSQHKCL